MRERVQCTFILRCSESILLMSIYKGSVIVVVKVPGEFSDILLYDLAHTDGISASIRVACLGRSQSESFSYSSL